MASTDDKQRNGTSRQWSVPRRQRRLGNAGKWPREPVPARPDTTPAGSRTPAQRGAEREKPAPAAIVGAVEEMREDLPRVGVGGLHQQFRCRGGRWALVTRQDVRIALAGIECAARREFVAPDTARRSRPVTRTPHGAWPQFQEAVAALRDRGFDVPAILGRLRDSGWRADHDDVAGALRRLKAGNAARPFPPGRSLPAPRPAGPGSCPSCGTPVTDLGLCRCS